MNLMKYILMFLIASTQLVEAKAQVPAPASGQHKKILILGGIAHVGNGEVIDNAAIAVENGYFRFVRNQMRQRVDVNQFDTVIYLQKQHIYPGFILPNTTLGLREVDAVRASLDFNDVGDYNPHVRSLIAYNTESRITPTVRTNGVLVAQVTPRGGVLSGTSSVVQLDAWNWEDAVVRKDDGIHLNWPKMYHHDSWTGKTVKNKKDESSKIQHLNRFFARAKAYAESDSATTVNLRLEAMKGLFDGSKTLYVHAQVAREILQAVVFKKEHKIKKMVIVGGYDAHLVAEALNDDKIGVIYRRVHALPMREDDPTDLPYKIPALLQEKGVMFCLDMAGDMEAMNARNLPFLAGTATAHGLEKEKAIQAITGNAAQILGLDNLLGTLESGKIATFFISDGDALDMMTNKVSMAFVNGKPIDLKNHQEILYERYSKKYGLDY